MLTVGLVSALAIVGGHAALACAVWPSKRVERPGIAPDPALRLRSATLEGIADTVKCEAANLRADLGRARLRHDELEAEVAASRAEVQELEDERTVLRREIRRLRGATVLAGLDDDRDDEDDEDDGSEGAEAPPAGPRRR